MTPPRSGAGRRGWRAAGLCFALVGVVTLLAYARSFESPFQLDDNGHIVGNPVLEAPSVEGVVYWGRTRLVPFATLALNYSFGGEDPFGFHIVNFAVHLLATFAVFNLAFALCRTPRLRDTWLAGQALVFATGAAFVFACHPIQIQSVTYVVQRMSAMATLFYVGSVLLYVRARNAQLGLGPGRPGFAYAGSGLLAICAFFSKESAASLPLAVLLTELSFYPRQRGARWLLRLAPFAVLVLVIPLTWGLLAIRPARYRSALNEPLLEQTEDLVRLLTFRANPGGQVTPLEYFLTQAVVIPHYLRMVLIPYGFNIDHDVPIATAISGPVLAGLAFLAALFACGLYALRRAPVVGFGLLWLFIALSVESSVLPIRDTMVEHRMYLAMPGIALAAGCAFAWVYRRWPAPALIAGACYVVLLAALTFARNEVWLTPLALWQDALAKSPGKARVHANVGAALHELGRLDEAIGHYCETLALDPRHGRAKHNLDNALDEQLEQRVEAGEEVKVLIFPDGSVEPVRRNPCQRRRITGMRP